MQTQPPPEQPISVARRPMDVEDYVDILRRHRAWILGPAFLGLVIGVVTAYLWEDSYISTGYIRVIPPQVPGHLVPSNVSGDMNQRIQQIYQEIIGRNFLTNLITVYNLYPDERKRLPNEDIVDMMRKDVGLGAMRNMSKGAGGLQQSVNAFSVSFSYRDRRLTQKVCNDVISRFVDESTRSRATQSVVTTEFFKDQHEIARRELEAIDQKITAFQRQFAGELPESAQSAVSRITALEATIQSLNSSINRASQDKLQLDTQLRILRDQASSISTVVPEQTVAATAKSERLVEIDREIQKLQSTLTTMRESWKDTHPDVQRLVAFLESKKKEREAILQEVESLRAEQAARPKAAAVPNIEGIKDLRETNAQIVKVQSALQAKDAETEDQMRQLRDAQGRLRRLQSQMDASPAVQQQYLQLTRERELIKERYEKLNDKMQQSSMATDLENRRQGETLELLESPIIPEDPYAPKRELIILGGLVVGAAIGVTLAGVRELKDTSLKNLKDVRAYTRLTVLGSIPFLENDFVVRRRRRMAWLAWTATFLVGILLMSGSVIYYYTSKT